MPVVDESIEINVPPEQLWQLASQPATTLLTSSNLVELTRTNRDNEGPAQVGDVLQGATRVAGRSLEWTAKVTSADPGKRMEMVSTEAPIPFSIRIDYGDLGDGRTEYRFHQESEEFGGVFGKLADAVVTRMYAKNVQSNLAALKEYAESL